MTTCCPQQDQYYDEARSLKIADCSSERRIRFLSVRALFQAFCSWYLIRRERKITRHAFLHLLTLDDQLLDDIGVTRESVIWAASLPLSEDAAEALESTSTRAR